jgi:hypothetical protein
MGWEGERCLSEGEDDGPYIGEGLKGASMHNMTVVERRISDHDDHNRYHEQSYHIWQMSFRPSPCC